jgi:hypothetical protein
MNDLKMTPISRACVIQRQLQTWPAWLEQIMDRCGQSAILRRVANVHAYLRSAGVLNVRHHS